MPMEYNGRYTAFDADRITTYPLRTRSNKVKLADLVFPRGVDALALELPEDVEGVLLVARGLMRTAAAEGADDDVLLELVEVVEGPADTGLGRRVAGGAEAAPEGEEQYAYT